VFFDPITDEVIKKPIYPENEDEQKLLYILNNFTEDSLEKIKKKK